MVSALAQALSEPDRTRYFTCAVHIIQGYRILAYGTDNFDSFHLNYRTNSLLELGEKIVVWEIPFAIVLYVTMEYVYVLAEHTWRVPYFVVILWCSYMYYST